MSIVHKTLQRDHPAGGGGPGGAGREAKNLPSAAISPDAEIERLRAVVRTRESRIQELEQALLELDHEHSESMRKAEARVQALEAQVQALVQKLTEAVAGLQRAREQRPVKGTPGQLALGHNAGIAGSLLSQAKSRR